jgi:16S rRNA (guanine966-N2)-methyltransferase
MVDSSAAAVAQIRENVELLRLEQVRVEQADACSWLEGTPPDPADIVFLDPPYDDNLLEAVCGLLEQRGWLKPGARIYVEADVGDPLATPAALWVAIRQKRSGRVCYTLFSNQETA